MVFLTGPRQIGKTYLAKQILNDTPGSQYLNFDDAEDRSLILDRRWNDRADLLVFDEIHKHKTWKRFLKGTFDTRREDQQILVTGSARMDTFRQSGESLAGRYFHYHLNPLSVRELDGLLAPFDAVEKLNRFGGFPEPLLADSDRERTRWENQYYMDIIREDILEFSRIHEIKTMRVLIELLRKRVGSPLSYRSLSQDLQIAPNTVRSYISILESLHIVFLIHPYHRNIARAILKAPKLYFYDTGYVQGDEGVKLENTVAVSLLKHIQFEQDYAGKRVSLAYARTKDSKEIDFVLTEDDQPECFIETKLSDTAVPGILYTMLDLFPAARVRMLVHHLRNDQSVDGIEISRLSDWLAGLSA